MYSIILLNLEVRYEHCIDLRGFKHNDEQSLVLKVTEYQLITQSSNEITKKDILNDFFRTYFTLKISFNIFRCITFRSHLKSYIFIDKNYQSPFSSINHKIYYYDSITVTGFLVSGKLHHVPFLLRDFQHMF